jgi:arylsulfatase A-like enzyme
MRALLLVTLAAIAACTSSPAPPRPLIPTNVVIVTIDTLRADRIGVYGAKNVETPRIDQLARDGAWAVNATVHAPLTRPSHVSLFTGRYPAEHGIRDNVSPPLGRDVPVLAEVFQREGFSTAAFVASAVLDRQSGLARGFATYSDRLSVNEDKKPGDVVISDAVEWMRDKTRFFAWIHLYDCHAPYRPPDRYATKYADRPYDGEVAFSDDLVGRLVDALRDAHTLENTLLIVTSDHGEGLGDHGEDVHGYFVYESTLRVPLVMHGPGVKPGSRLDKVVRTIDLFPTIVEIAALGAKAPQTSGRSVASALQGGTMTEEPSFAESLVPLLQFGWSDLRAVRDGRWKFIMAPRAELYDLERDPGEQRNLLDSEQAKAKAMRAALDQRLMQEQRAVRTDSAKAGVPPELLERLGALGYVSPGRGADTKPSGADPKDKLDEYKSISTEMTQGLVALRANRPAEALDHFNGLGRHGVDGYELHYYRGRAYTGLQRWRDAAAEYEAAIKKIPGDVPAWRALGESRVQLGDTAGALRAFEQLVAIAPDDAMGQMALGEVYRDLKRWREAAIAMRAALAVDPNPALYWNALGTALGNTGEMPKAERAFAEAVTREGNNALYLYNHALALRALGRSDEAIAELQRAAALDYAPARTLLAQLGGRSRK